MKDKKYFKERFDLENEMISLLKYGGPGDLRDAYVKSLSLGLIESGEELKNFCRSLTNEELRELLDHIAEKFR